MACLAERKVEKTMRSDRDQISMRQLMAMVWTGLLAPATGVLPGVTAAMAGEGAWLSTVIAIPMALLGGWILWRLSRRGGGALGPAFCQVLGKAGGASSHSSILYGH